MASSSGDELHWENLGSISAVYHTSNWWSQERSSQKQLQKVPLHLPNEALHVINVGGWLIGVYRFFSAQTGYIAPYEYEIYCVGTGDKTNTIKQWNIKPK